MQNSLAAKDHQWFLLSHSRYLAGCGYGPPVFPVVVRLWSCLHEEVPLATIFQSVALHRDRVSQLDGEDEPGWILQSFPGVDVLHWDHIAPNENERLLHCFSPSAPPWVFAQKRRTETLIWNAEPKSGPTVVFASNSLQQPDLYIKHYFHFLAISTKLKLTLSWGRKNKKSVKSLWNHHLVRHWMTTITVSMISFDMFELEWSNCEVSWTSLFWWSWRLLDVLRLSPGSLLDNCDCAGCASFIQLCSLLLEPFLPSGHGWNVKDIEVFPPALHSI